jgi:glucosamine-6-phosphate deaminase
MNVTATPSGVAASSPSTAGHTVERIPVSVHPDAAAASRQVAGEIAQTIRYKNSRGEKAVLGLATGSTPTGVYDELIRLHQEEGLSFQNVVTFNLDEYWPMQPGDLQSYRRFMDEHLFDHIDIDKSATHVPDGTLAIEDVSSFCRDYEQKITVSGGLDIQLLGIGRTGHVGFNEPGSPRDSRTRLITLDKVTRADAAADFFGEENVPRRAITMGVASIMDARRVILLAFGEHKAPVVVRAVEGEVDAAVSASFLQGHDDARFVLDPAAAAALTRIARPWLLGPLGMAGLAWDETMIRSAVIWLARKLDKPLLKLTDADYNENGLQELVASRGSAYEINIEVFKGRSRTITGWPGGKPKDKLDYSGVYRGSDAFPKRVVVFSPHPDDDVISMGGTFIRLCDQGHDVHVAYQTSGNIAVWDDSARRHADLLAEAAEAFDLDAQEARKVAETIGKAIDHKGPGDVDPDELKAMKGLIRRTEARAAARYSGVKDPNIHFLDLPFYETGRVRKKPLSDEDVQITVDLLKNVRPHQVYTAGDLSDPHGTHRTCLTAVLRALEECKSEDWYEELEVWLYRGAWQEWEPEQIEMAVPLSPGEVARKRTAIYKHESQKDAARFPGRDAREFWQRAEDRTRETAKTYDDLGLQEYEAIEGFVRWKGEMI